MTKSVRLDVLLPCHTSFQLLIRITERTCSIGIAQVMNHSSSCGGCFGSSINENMIRDTGFWQEFLNIINNTHDLRVIECPPPYYIKNQTIHRTEYLCYRFQDHG